MRSMSSRSALLLWGLSLALACGGSEQPLFSDGHESGLFTWAYLYELGRDQDRLMREYEDKLAAAGLDRDAPMPAKAAGGHSHGGGACASH